MSLLIDGYNLLNATGIPSREKGPGNLERARQALIELRWRNLCRRRNYHGRLSFSIVRNLLGAWRSSRSIAGLS